MRFLGVWGWGAVICAVVGFVLYGIVGVWLYCDPQSGSIECPNGSHINAVVTILKEFGAVIGIVGAGAGVAWSNFYKSAQDAGPKTAKPARRFGAPR